MRPWNRKRRLLRRWFGYPLEAGAAHALVLGVRLLPFAWASALGGWLGRLAGPRLRVSGIARKNLARTFPEKTGAEIEAIVKAMWNNLGRVAFEFPLLDRLHAFDPKSRLEIVGRDILDRLRDDGRAGLLFSGHFGNWEVGSTPLFQAGLKPAVFFRAPNNPLMAGLYAMRERRQGRMFPKGAGGARQAVRWLKDGGHLCMLVDQKMNDGIEVPFMGRPAMTAPALAQFALRYQCPVVPVRVERLAGARFRVTYFEPWTIEDRGERTADVARFMTRVNETLESWIRERPEQWLWLHSRWKD